MKTITYYLSPQSPWTYLGHDRLMAMAKTHGATIEPRPCALNSAIFPVSGGLPLKQRSVQRQAYRLVELQRWSEHLGIPLNIHPKFFPVDESVAAMMIAATVKSAGNDAALTLTGALLRAVWSEERDISNADTLVQIANENGLDGKALYAAHAQAKELFDEYTREAIERQVFGAPWYEYQGVPYWGQDRLEFLERALILPERNPASGQHNA